jgi:hypothetical protein
MYPLPEYFNTSNLSGPALKKEIRNAKTQNQLILQYFKRMRQASPSMIYRLRRNIGLDEGVPITSRVKGWHLLTI